MFGKDKNMNNSDKKKKKKGFSKIDLISLKNQQT